jgi:prepilin-type N-terminal cleavage/methylation domain-containing protein
MKKAFTLVELLAVIIILGIIGLIVFPRVNDIINSSGEKLYREQIERLISATESWESANDGELSEEEVVFISIEELKRAGNLEKKDIENPINNETMEGNMAVEFDSDYNQFVTYYCGESIDDEYLEIFYEDTSIYEHVIDICY